MLICVCFFLCFCRLFENRDTFQIIQLVTVHKILGISFMLRLNVLYIDVYVRKQNYTCEDVKLCTLFGKLSTILLCTEELNSFPGLENILKSSRMLSDD